MIIIELDDEQAKLYRDMNDNFENVKAFLAAKPWKIGTGQAVLDISEGLVIKIGRLHPNRIEPMWKRHKLQQFQF